jgi:hypothetical protein
MIRRLEDCIGDAIADVGPLAAQIGVGMVDIADDLDRVIIFAVAVDDHAP